MMFGKDVILMGLFISSLTLTDVSHLFQSDQESGAPWWLLWLLIIIALISAVIWWATDRDQEQTGPAAQTAPPSSSIETQASPAAVEAVTAPAPVIEEKPAPTVEVEAETAPATEEEAAPIAEVEATTTAVPAIEEESSPAEEEAAPVAESTIQTPAAEEKPVPTTAAPVAEAPPPKPDNLTRIEGIGPKISGVLREAGITTFAQLANTEISQLEQILKEAEIKIAFPETWPEQAKFAAASDWEGLKTLQGELKGGRRRS